MSLKELLGEELFNQVSAKIGDQKIAIVSDGNWFPKSKFDEVNEARKQADAALAERDKQLGDLKKAAEGNEELQATIKTLQDENKAAAEKYQQEAQELQLKTALKLKLGGKVHETALEDVLSQFDTSRIVLDEHGNIKEGYDGQEKSLRESKGFYFVPEGQGGATFTGFKPFEGSNPAGGGNDNNFGKQLAANNKQNNESSAKAQELYFK
ncbi:phage scaffolding protein [Paenibacillus lautus]|uniref:phage scaffolding protein n=1 Tax=Paenibacillus lautus TaxID=1401 RepID=UPI003D270DED